MIQRKENGEANPETRVWGYLIGVQLEIGTSPDQIAMKLADALQFVEGVGDVTVDVLGQVDVVEPEAEMTITEWGTTASHDH